MSKQLQNPDVLENGIQRFAISGLSKNRSDEAVNEEILLDKHTGEFLIKNKDGVVISTDYFSRRSSTMNNVTMIADKSNIGGDLYEIDIDDIYLPAKLDYNINILNGDITLSNDIRKILLYLDVDEYVNIDNKAVPENVSGKAKVEIEIGMDDGVTNTMSIIKDINVLNNFVINLKDTVGNKVVTSLKIKSIVFSRDSLQGQSLILYGAYITLNI